MEFKEISPELFDSFAKTHEKNSIFQTSSWAAIKNNWDAKYYAVFSGDEIVCASLVLIRDIKFGLKFAYSPRGPLADYGNGEHLKFFFENVKKHLLKQKVVLYKFDLNVKISTISIEEREQIPELTDPKFVRRIESLGTRHTGYTLQISESIQPRIQLAYDIEGFDQSIPKRTRKKVRASLNKGVTFEFEDHADNLSEIVRFTEKRHGINLRNKEYFQNILSGFKEDATVLTAFYEGTPVSSCILVKSQDQAEILYSGYNDDYKHLNSTYPMRYNAIQWARDNGCRYFNFGGVEGDANDGLFMFKKSFAPNIDVYVGEFDVMMLPVLSRVASKGFARLRQKD